MRAKCKHRNAIHHGWHPQGGYWYEAPYLARYQSDAACCIDCGSWLPLGKARDDGEHAEAIRIEINAADIAARWAPLDRESFAVLDGWYCHRDGCAPNRDEFSEQAGYLARQIATHDDGGE